jgi:hypothetical protein
MYIPPGYLTERITLEDVLAEHDFSQCPPDFRQDWERLLSKRMDGDELWRFAPPAGALKMWGVALLRQGEVISTLVEAVG